MQTYSLSEERKYINVPIYFDDAIRFNSLVPEMINVFFKHIVIYQYSLILGTFYIILEDINNKTIDTESYLLIETSLETFELYLVLYSEATGQNILEIFTMLTNLRNYYDIETLVKTKEIENEIIIKIKINYMIDKKTNLAKSHESYDWEKLVNFNQFKKEYTSFRQSELNLGNIFREFDKILKYCDKLMQSI